VSDLKVFHCRCLEPLVVPPQPALVVADLSDFEPIGEWLWAGVDLWVI
jgi:hypothetical protein